ncbi:hypothetical protein B0H19DRAFT_1258766 [Mycena capillaripes]|nr:hypothetical protein B0H19DRAFT_1258766 [Mycena capillaripes]
MSLIIFKNWHSADDIERAQRDREWREIADKWRARPPSNEVDSYDAFLLIAQRHRDGPQVCSAAIASRHLALRHPHIFSQWLTWHTVSNSLTADDNYGGYGPHFGTTSAIAGWGAGGGWGTGGWGTGGGWKKQQKARLRTAKALDAAQHEEFEALAEADGQRWQWDYTCSRS